MIEPSCIRLYNTSFNGICIVHKTFATFEQTAPAGLAGKKRDFYYVVHLYRINLKDPLLSVLFTESQLKQWQLYYKEMLPLYNMLDWGTTPLDLSLIVEGLSTTTSNHP